MRIRAIIAAVREASGCELHMPAAATAISDMYYSDGRAAGANLEKLGMQIGLDGLANVLKEFWPDVKHRLFERNQDGTSRH